MGGGALGNEANSNRQSKSSLNYSVSKRDKPSVMSSAPTIATAKINTNQYEINPFGD